MGKTTGEVTPAYAVPPEERVRLINSWIPELRIIYIMRDPVLRAWSQAKKDFSRFFGKDLEQASEGELVSFFTKPAVAKRGDYLTCLRTWMKFYDLRQFFITFTEDLSNNPKVLKAIFLFLGLNPEVELEWDEIRKPVHVGPDIHMPDRIRSLLIEMLYQQNDQLESLLGRKVPWK